MGLTEMPFHCLLKNVSLDLTMGVQNNSSKYCWIGRVFDLIYYSPIFKSDKRPTGSNNAPPTP